jgi:hypothetical protein
MWDRTVNFQLSRIGRHESQGPDLPDDCFHTQIHISGYGANEELEIYSSRPHCANVLAVGILTLRSSIVPDHIGSLPGSMERRPRK